MRNIPYISIAIIALTVLSCKKENNKADGYGNFEATEIIVSSEANGKILSLQMEEGDELKEGAIVGYTDTTQLILQMKELETMLETISARSAGVLSQIRILEEQIVNVTRDRDRIKRLLADSAATPKQLDDLNGQLKVIEQQKHSIEVQNQPVLSEKKSIDVQMEKVKDQLQKSRIKNPVDGTVLVKYAEEGEVTTFGKPVYKIANLKEMILRVYISETQLAQIKVNQKVKVIVDENDGESEMEGIVRWISSTAEFTPKIIQTKEERVNLVYAVKVSVKNSGKLKIGMPGEIHIN